MSRADDPRMPLQRRETYVDARTKSRVDELSYSTYQFFSGQICGFYDAPSYDDDLGVDGVDGVQSLQYFHLNHKRNIFLFNHLSTASSSVLKIAFHLLKMITSNNAAFVTLTSDKYTLVYEMHFRSILFLSIALKRVSEIKINLNRKTIEMEDGYEVICD